MRHIQALSDESSLIPLVGNQARRIWELANGVDDRPVETDRKIQSIGAEETYEEDLTDGSTIELELDTLPIAYQNAYGNVIFWDTLYRLRCAMMTLPPYPAKSG